jgi:hypothetical protein
MNFKETGYHLTNKLAAIAESLRFRYKGLRALLAKNSEMLEKMADLEADLSTMVPEESRIRLSVIQLLSGTLLLSEDLTSSRKINFVLFMMPTRR